MTFINKDEVIAAIKAEMDTLQTHCLTDGTARLKLRAVKNAVEKAESIDIVRCGGCRYWAGNDNGDIDDWEECRWREDEATDADDYCSYGERREP